MGNTRFSISAFAVLLMACLSATSFAEVERFEILKREPFADGKSFGEVGAYERIVAKVHYALDPKLRQNQAVVDLNNTRRDPDGKVRFHGDLFLLVPKDPSRGNHALVYDVNNRGNKLALRFFNFADSTNNPLSEQHAGDGFLMRHGFTVVWSGWDGELLPGDDRLRLAPPVASDNGKLITGLVRCEIYPAENVPKTVVNWANHGSYRPTAGGLTTATLTHRVRPGDPREPVSRDQWRVHVTDVASDSPTQLPKVELEFRAGLQKGHLYELIYEAQDPLVHGVCFTGLRDLMASFKHGTGRDNPLVIDGQSTIRRAYGFGVSQSGRFLREFLYSGFNEDELGQKVFDGLMPHVAGSGLGSFNYRFAQPTRHVTQHDHHDYPADRFPFAYETQHDPLSDQTDGILQRATESGTAPFILHTQSAAEYWTRSGSLTHTDPLGEHDALVPDNVRFFSFGGTQHGPSGFPPQRGDGQNLANPGDYRPFLRALLLALHRWSDGGAPAPPSVYPTTAAGTLVAWDQKSTGFPNVPGVRYPAVIQQPDLLDFGPRWQCERIMDIQPPRSRGSYRVLVPKCGPDGNELGCLSPPEVAVPVATHTGWNLRSQAAGAENELVSLTGSFIPFPTTTSSRQENSDPRLSLQERYGSLKAYLQQLEAKCRELESAGYLLSEDVERTLKVHRERAAGFFTDIRNEP